MVMLQRLQLMLSEGNQKAYKPTPQGNTML